jgi:hypothetical protein
LMLVGEGRSRGSEGSHPLGSCSSIDPHSTVHLQPRHFEGGGMWVHPYPATTPETQPETGLRITSAMWRRVLTQPSIAPGSPVLVAGQRPLDAMELLVDLAFDVTGWCADPNAVILARKHVPKADSRHWRTQTPLNSDASRYALTLVLDSLSPERNLYSLAARLETAHLLGSLRPGGRLVHVVAVSDSGQCGHTADCWQRHLDCFPGSISAVCLNRRSRGWSLLSGRQSDTAIWAMSCATPQATITPDEWVDYARRGMLTGQRQCCAAAATEIVPLPAEWRQAG